jgi:pimeloyl-ACP methyl ester carboxylesterase
MGALLYAAEHAEMVERVILLAPFIATKGTLAALAKTGGLAVGGLAVDGLAASPLPSIVTAAERKLLAWLREYIIAGRRCPKLLLGYGLQDRFAPGHRMLAENLAPENVVTLPGLHDWTCWRALFTALLAAHPADWTAMA